MINTLLCSLVLATTQSVTAPTSVTPEAAMTQLRQLVAKSAAHASIVTIGRSWTGRPIEVVAIGADPSKSDTFPAILLVSGLDGSRPGSVSIAVAAVEHLLSTPELWRACTFYVIPCANPDAFAGPSLKWEGRANRSAHPIDEDRDGRIDEDQPRDINCDGAITMMRRLSPPASDPPTHMIDPGDGRLMRIPDATKDQRATHSLFVEGTDSDLDGSIAEDDFGGIDIDRNFPHRWSEFDRTAGAFPLSEPESQALAQFVLTHSRIVGALVIGRWDNLVKTPDSNGRDITGKTPLALDGADQSTWQEMGKKWRELSAQARSTECDPSGSLALWLYAHRGIPTFSTQAWGRPDASPPPAAAPPAPQPVPSDPAAPTAPPAPIAPIFPLEKPADEEAAAWLAWSDRDQSGRGFVPWVPFDHPTLGRVEIGGFRSGFRTDPPASEIARLGIAVSNFMSELAKRRPRIAWESVTAKAVGGGVIEVEAALVNQGWLPTATAMGKSNRQSPPVIVTVSVPKARILAGQRVTLVDALAGAGGRRSFRWLVTALQSEPITIEARWEPGETQRLIITGTTVTLPAEIAR
ncbi:MAG: hypothetical protein EXS15_00435 [Phycisphaerales bacterium]|nr:hypothetical protein [Phycisphaerales bacterium]